MAAARNGGSKNGHRLITGATGISISLVVSVIGAALFVQSKLSTVREDLLPRLSSIEENLRGIAGTMSEMKGRLGLLVTRAELELYMKAEAGPIAAQQARILQRLTGIETRLEKLEQK